MALSSLFSAFYECEGGVEIEKGKENGKEKGEDEKKISFYQLCVCMSIMTRGFVFSPFSFFIFSPPPPFPSQDLWKKKLNLPTKYVEQNKKKYGKAT